MISMREYRSKVGNSERIRKSGSEHMQDRVDIRLTSILGSRTSLRIFELEDGELSRVHDIETVSRCL